MTALYPYRNGRVIQTTAAFRQGASGGGLFDRHGNLVGITTFFKRNGAESSFFAIPVEWVDSLTATADSQPDPMVPIRSHTPISASRLAAGGKVRRCGTVASPMTRALEVLRVSCSSVSRERLRKD